MLQRLQRPDRSHRHDFALDVFLGIKTFKTRILRARLCHSSGNIASSDACSILSGKKGNASGPWNKCISTRSPVVSKQTTYRQIDLIGYVLNGGLFNHFTSHTLFQGVSDSLALGSLIAGIVLRTGSLCSLSNAPEVWDGDASSLWRPCRWLYQLKQLEPETPSFNEILARMTFEGAFENLSCLGTFHRVTVLEIRW